MNNKIKITPKGVVKIGLLSYSVVTLGNVSWNAYQSSQQEEIRKEAKERFEKAYLTTDEETFYLDDDMYVIIDDDKINICERAVTLETDYPKLEEYGYLIYEGIDEIPDEKWDYIFSSRIHYITNEDGQQFLRMKTDEDYYFLQPSSRRNGVPGYCITAETESFHDVATGEFVSPVIIRDREADELALMSWVVPDKELVNNEDDKFTYDEIKGFAEEYVAKTLSKK